MKSIQNSISLILYILFHQVRSTWHATHKNSVGLIARVLTRLLIMRPHKRTFTEPTAATTLATLAPAQMTINPHVLEIIPYYQIWTSIFTLAFHGSRVIASKRGSGLRIYYLGNRGGELGRSAVLAVRSPFWNRASDNKQHQARDLVGRDPAADMMLKKSVPIPSPCFF